MRRFRFHVLVACAAYLTAGLLLPGGPASAAEDAKALEGREVLRIDVDVPAALDAAWLRERIGVRVGDAYSGESVQQDIAALYALGEFADVRVEAKALGEKVRKEFTPYQQFVAMLKDEMIEIMGGAGEKSLSFGSELPSVLMLVGLQGSGKTTTAGKLSRFLGKRGRSPALVSTDLKRPAAREQLRVVGEEAGVPVIEGREESVEGILAAAVKACRTRGFDTLLVDTAGRLHVDEEMMEELPRIRQWTKADEVLFVVDAMTGQDGVKSAEEFVRFLPLTGIVITKIDGDARGGVALSVSSVARCPVLFAGTGEKLADFEFFRPERIVSRILGMGDILTLIEETEKAVDEREAAEMGEALLKESFNLEDLLKHLKMIGRMGSFEKLLKLLPGVDGKLLEGADPKTLARKEALILSMTGEERRHPELIKGSRKRRIAKGAGSTVEEVNLLLKEFRKMTKMMRSMSKLMKGKKKPAGFPLDFFK